MSFVHLHNHTEYSLLNGAIRVPEIIKKAKQFDMKALAITDYGNIFGAVDFYTSAKKAGIKPIIGCVVFHPSNDQHTLRSHRRGIDRLNQLVLLIKNKTGYHNLCQLITKSYLEGFYYKPRVDSELLKLYSEGLMVLSGGWDSSINHFLYEGNKEKAKAELQKYVSIYSDNFYIELQENGLEGQHQLNLELLELAKEEGVPVVASNNCHYLNRDEAEAFEILLCIQTGATIHNEHSHLKFSTDGYYFKTPEEMVEAFQYAPEAISNTLNIADECSFDFDLKNYYFPKLDPPAGKTLDEHLHDEATKGLDSRWKEILHNRNLIESGGTSEKKTVSECLELRSIYEKRLDTELQLIKKMGFSGYFLIVSDFIRFAKENAIPVGPGRGSAAGSLVAYCTSITDLDPLPYNLLFERFLNPERITMPDVDIDFCMHGRDKVLEYVGRKYGNVSQIITFGKMKAKAVIRDVGRVMNMPYSDVDKIAKLIPNAINITLEDALKQEPRLKKISETDPLVARLLHTAQQLEGLNRHASTHAAGVVMSDRPLTDFLPLYKGSNGDVVTQFDMKSVEKIGLIKFDFLGLKTLTIIHDALRIIKRTREVDLNLLDIPLNDQVVYELLSKGDTSGIFQLESSGMRDLLCRMNPSTFEDLIALLALYRPGPLGSGMVDDFISRKQGKTKIVYDLPQLAPILEETYGVIVYQEQVMRIASVLGGYSLGEADILRRAMGKKKANEMAAQRARFLEGCIKNKIGKNKAEKIFDLMAKFAEYGFNKSHSAAYALVSYQTAYLKAYYPVEYLASILTNEMQNTDRIQSYIQDCEAHNIKVLPPDINESYYGFSVLDSNLIRFGLGAIKNIGKGAIESIIQVRESKGPFKSFFHFCSLVDHHKMNRRVIESLIKCGAFDSIEKNRACTYSVIDQAVHAVQKMRAEEDLGQTNLFNLMEEEGNTQLLGIDMPHIPEWHVNERLAYEKEAVGFYLTGHPLKIYEAVARRVSTSNSKHCQNLGSETSVTLVGMVAQSKVITTKKGSRMAFVSFEDLLGSIEVIIFSDLFQKITDLLGQDKPLVLQGVVDKGEEGAKIIAKDLVLLDDYLSQNTKSVHFRIPALLLTDDRLRLFHEVLNEYNGVCRGYLHLIQNGESETVLELFHGIRLDDSDKLSARINSLFEQKVVEYGI